MQTTDLPRYRLTHLLHCLPATAALAWLGVASCVWAQPAFSPPPPVQTNSAAVRGLAIAPQSMASPANVAPAVGAPVAAPITPTPTVTGNVKPVEGAEIVARIDGQIVLASDVLWQVNQLIEANRDRIPADKIEIAKRGLLQQQVMGLIDTKILYADFRRKVPAENLPSIFENLEQPFEESEVPRLVKMLSLEDRNELVRILEDSGTTLKDLQRQFNERTIAGEWLRQMTPKPKVVTHEEMLAYYKEHKQDFQFPAKVKWEELMISTSRMNGDRAAAWREISTLGNEVWQKVSSQPNLRGAVFTEIAKAKSHGFTAKLGGQHDWTTRGALRSEKINQQLFTLKIGQLSNVIESERGFHIIRVLDRTDAGCTPFTKAQSEIRTVLEKVQRKGLSLAEVQKLRKKSRVWTIFDGDMSGPQLSEKLSGKKRR